MTIDSRLAATYRAPPNLLGDKLILVTGAGDGIGRAAALTLAQHGATVILAGRTVVKLEQVYDKIVAAGLAQPAIFPVDLNGATSDDYRLLATDIDERFGRLDGLLHNAGQLGQRTPLASYSPAIWQQVMQVNVTAQFLLTQALLPVLKKSVDASVVFTTSSVGRQGRAYWGAYAVSKFATEGMVQVWADELEGTSNVRVNCLNPGATRTAMRATAYPAEDPGKLKSPEQIMAAYLYLLGPDSTGISGESVDAQ